MARAQEPVIWQELPNQELAHKDTVYLTVVDRLNVCKDDRNRGRWTSDGCIDVNVVWKIDVPRWKALLYRALGG